MPKENIYIFSAFEFLPDDFVTEKDCSLFAKL